MKQKLRPKQFTLTAFLITLCVLITLQSCKKKRSDMAVTMYKKTQNKVFKNITPEAFTPIFQKELETESASLSNPKLITAFYEQHDYDPLFVMDHLKTDDLKLFSDYLLRANSHGINPDIFNAQDYANLVNKFYDKKAIKTTDEGYRDIAKLEIMTANMLINYSGALQYGLVNPKQLFNRYYIETARPDSAFKANVLNVTNFKMYLDSIQPKDPQYVALQKALADSGAAAGMTPEQTKRVIAVNLERLRWKNKPTANKYVLVNIPDFRLDVIENGKSTLNMKVCVGQGRNKDYKKSLVSYQDTDKVDRPFPRETPLLASMIYEAQVNPIWNIPQSIVSKEIVKHAQDDPNYLDNSHINVYHNGKKLEETSDINWGSVNLSDYEFKQQPGEDNSLGKVKFLFPNKSSVYLHDTPAQEPFKYDMRAVSHGCVRLEKPLDFAHALFGDGKKYELIAKDMADDKPAPTDVTLPKKVPVFITYVTCWADDTGTVQYRKDVYGLDIVLYSHLQKFLTV